MVPIKGQEAAVGNCGLVHLRLELGDQGSGDVSLGDLGRLVCLYLDLGDVIQCWGWGGVQPHLCASESQAAQTELCAPGSAPMSRFRHPTA